MSKFATDELVRPCPPFLSLTRVLGDAVLRDVYVDHSCDELRDELLFQQLTARMG